MKLTDMVFGSKTQVVFDLLKNGKAQTFASLRKSAAKTLETDKVFLVRRLRNLGRRLRAEGIGDVVMIKRDEEQGIKHSTAQIITGAVAKKSIAEKTERYKNLKGAKARAAKAAKKAGKKVVAKKSAAKKTAVSKKPAKKAAAKKTVAAKAPVKKLVKKVVKKVLAGGSSESESAQESES